MTDSSDRRGAGSHVRRPLNQHADWFHDPDNLASELTRVFDICHSCRRCVNLCNAFPTLFRLIDNSPGGEVDTVPVADFQQVVDQCYLCDLCYRSKCPYVPPHEWNLDFPQSILRAKVVKFEEGTTRWRDRLITSTGTLGQTASLPLLNPVANALTSSPLARSALEKTLGIHSEAHLPRYHRPTFRNAMKHTRPDPEQHTDPLDVIETTPAGGERVVLFATCYCNFNAPAIGHSLYRVLRHNGIEVSLPGREACCGMPKLELGDLTAVDHLMEQNIDVLYPLAKAGWMITSAMPTCVLMFRQMLPALYPDDARVQRVAEAFWDPFEFLHRLYRNNRLNLDFRHGLGVVSYHVACHQRAQGIGPRTQQILELIPDTQVKRIERCSGHNGTYAVKRESRRFANRIAAPVVAQVARHEADHMGSDCPLAGQHIEDRLGAAGHTDAPPAQHPLQLLCKAYGI